MNYFSQLFEDVTNLLKEEYQKRELFFNFRYKDAVEEIYYDSIPKHPENDVNIRVVFYNDREYIEDNYHAPENVLGFHAITSPNSVSGFNDSHEVFINCNHSDILKACFKSRMDEFDPYSSKYDYSILNALLITLTHEIEHAVEFIENSNGLSPEQLDNMDVLTHEISYGIFSLPEAENVFFGEKYNDLMFEDKYEILNEMLEERIENKGQQVLEKLLPKIYNLPSYQKCLEKMEIEFSSDIEKNRSIHLK
jgi:hypothetical protein